VLTAQGDPRGALENAALGRELLDRSGARIGQPVYLGFAAQAQIVLGHLEDAAASLRDIDVMIETGQRWTEANVRCSEGDLMLARGDVAAAEACWRRAVAIARAQGAASWELRAATRLALFLADRGSPSDAANLLAPVLAKIEGGRGTPDFIAAAALLRELGD
jgi:ATP/maltotriose-dependent transcriptional regulator MalT